MGSFDGAEVWDLVGPFILAKLENEFGGDNVGLYRDDGLALINSTTGRDAVIAKKRLHEILRKIGFKMTAQVSHQIFNFLDITCIEFK